MEILGGVIVVLLLVIAGLNLAEARGHKARRSDRQE
jgi:hypothetical protein